MKIKSFITLLKLFVSWSSNRLVNRSLSRPCGLHSVYGQAGVFIVIAFLLVSCNNLKEYRYSGETMGTTFHITILASHNQIKNDIQKQIDKRLTEINKSMSTYDKNSEINKFNALSVADEPLSVSDDFYQVLINAKKLHEMTQGAWDGTVRPLVQRWGFARRKGLKHLPEKNEIQAILANIGFGYVEILADHRIKKNKSEVTLDLASIAKGYAVDQLSELLKGHGLTRYLVEIGGEVYAAGVRLDGKNWRVGINTPSKDAAYNDVYRVISIKNQALATSGDYRNYFELNGKRYAHVIDPATGYPVTNHVASVSILADTCTFADGLATAIMVMGPEKGIALVNRLPNTECLVIIGHPDQRFETMASKNFVTQ